MTFLSPIFYLKIEPFVTLSFPIGFKILLHFKFSKKKTNRQQTTFVLNYSSIITYDLSSMEEEKEINKFLPFLFIAFDAHDGCATYKNTQYFSAYTLIFKVKKVIFPLLSYILYVFYSRKQGESAAKQIHVDMRETITTFDGVPFPCLDICIILSSAKRML